MSEPNAQVPRCTACGGAPLSLTGRHDSNGECECRFITPLMAAYKRQAEEARRREKERLMGGIL
jgi:hypothetical protein